MRKGDLVAFEVQHVRHVASGITGKRGTVERWTTWHIGRVLHATTKATGGKLKEVEDGSGRRWKMLAKGYAVIATRTIPEGHVRPEMREQLFDACGGRDFGSLEECRAFAAAFAVVEIRLAHGLESSE